MLNCPSEFRQQWIQFSCDLFEISEHPEKITRLLTEGSFLQSIVGLSTVDSGLVEESRGRAFSVDTSS